MTIEEFIAARIDEDEAIAQSIPHGEWRAEIKHGAALVIDSDADTVVIVGDERENAHIARHDPARALRQAPVLRAVLELVQGMVSASQQIEAEETVLYPLAAVWSNHPDHREEWLPREIA